MAKNHIYIVDGVRTPIGGPFRSLKEFTAGELAAIPIKGLIRRNKLRKNSIDEVIFGNTVSAGAGQNPARQAAILANVPVEAPAYTVNNVCGAGMQSIILAMQTIQAKGADLIIAGGTESATQCPLLFPSVNEDLEVSKAKGDKFLESLINDGLYCRLAGKRMGELIEDLVRKSHISRAEQDLYAMQSHVKAIEAQDSNKFTEEIEPVQISKKRFLQEDEKPRRNIQLWKLESLRPAFSRHGTVTAGNASTPCDGASAVIVACEKAVKRFRLKPKARIVGFSSIGVNPEETFTASVKSIKTCLKDAKLSLNSIDLFELSEAFAAQTIYTKNKLHIPDDKVNIWGGDIALGHPLGAAGTRILITLMNALIDQKKRRGLANICLGGGGSITMIIEIV